MTVMLIIDNATNKVVNVAVPPAPGQQYKYDEEAFTVVFSDAGGIGWTYQDGELIAPPEEVPDGE